MIEDEKRYTDYRVENIRSKQQDLSTNRLSQTTLDGVDWTAISTSDKPVVLDLRCGDGKKTVERFTRYLDLVSCIIGIDSSASKILSAKEKYKDSDKFEFLCLDLDSENIVKLLQNALFKHEANRFGLIYGEYVLIHLTDPQLFIDRIYDLLQSGGYVVFQEPDDSGKICFPNENVLNTIIDSFNSLPWVEDRFFGKKIPYILHKAGLTDIKCNYDVLDNLSKSDSEIKYIYDVTFSHRRFDYDCVSESDRQNNIHIGKKLDEALDQMKVLLFKEDFYYAETRYIFSARKF